MCFGDPVDKHGVPQAPLFLYLADQRPKHQKNYGKGGRYGNEVRTAGRGWQGKDDPRYRPRDEAPRAERRGGGSTRGGGGGGLVYPPGPPQGGNNRVRGDAGGGGRVRVPPAVNGGRGNGGGRGPGPRGPSSQGSGSRNGGSQRGEPPPPIVRDFGTEGAHGEEEDEPQAPGMAFPVHTAGTPTVLSDSSSEQGGDAGAASSRAGAGARGLGGGEEHGQIPVGGPLVSPPSSEVDMAHSVRSHRSGSTQGGRHTVAVRLRSESRQGSVSSRHTRYSRRTGGSGRNAISDGEGADQAPESGLNIHPPPSVAASRHSSASHRSRNSRGGADPTPATATAAAAAAPPPPPSIHSHHSTIPINPFSPSSAIDPTQLPLPPPAHPPKPAPPHPPSAKPQGLLSERSARRAQKGIDWLAELEMLVRGVRRAREHQRIVRGRRRWIQGVEVEAGV